MKIKKYNESYQSNKIITAYNNSILHECDVAKKHHKELRDKTLKFINEYISLNEAFKKKHYIDVYGRDIVTDFHFDSTPTLRGRLTLDFEYNSGAHSELNYSEIKEFLQFLKDPNLYKTAKNYNL